MDKDRIEEIDLLDQIIVGRVDPVIYAFQTNTIPNYLKVGDTYRPLNVRLKEWQKLFPDLLKRFEGKAIINDDVFFRDYAVHNYLEQELKKKRLEPYDLAEDLYFSKEFFKDTEAKDVLEAIEDIKYSYDKGIDKYDYYRSSNRLPAIYHHKRQANWMLRPNQQEVVDQFLNAIEKGRTNLLMYAVMRFGKSFTSLCCALEMGANITLIVSAKADVKDEWKKTVESAGNFEGFVFLESDNLLANEKIIQEKINNNKKVVLFLTLQDLQGDEIKDKHKELFQHDIDLLIVDETHFGARAESFGAVLKEERKNITKLDDESVEQSEVQEQIKSLNANVKLHLSGTPYRILMGSEFEKEDIISFVQFSDVVAEQEDWDSKNLSKDDVNEWDNPYFGFPQMIRFAFNPNKSSINKMNQLKKTGVSFAFSALFEPISIRKDIKNKGHKKFKHEEEILDLLRVIDGNKEDSNLLGFLDYDKIKEGKMCRHMVMVLPYCASCDAMEELIKKNSSYFKNFNDYEIINISGVEGGSNYKKPSDIKNAIQKFEEEDKKTLTLTVNRMLTGSTVEQWDTMMYLKDTASPQEYDQAVFRLQNQYVRTYSNKTGFIKENMKPQTLLVDFDPDRLFRMQEQKSLIYNVNTEKNGNAKLQDRIREELRISPVIVMNKNKIQQVEATNILEAVSNYNKNRSVSDEVSDIPVDYSILDDALVRQEIERQSDFNSKGALSIKPVEGYGDELDLEYFDKENGVTTNNTKGEIRDRDIDDSKEDIESFYKKIQTYYQRILFYAFLSKEPVNSLDDIISSLRHSENKRLSSNLYLDVDVLKRITNSMDPFKRSSLDYKIQNISRLAEDKSISPIERALTSLQKFNRMSDSEIITPSKVCDDMVKLIPEEGFRKLIGEGKVLLDIASKSGEYAVALYNILTDKLSYSLDEIRNTIYSIPTSTIAYEFTRKFYEIMDLNIDNIAVNFNSYDLLEITKESGTTDYIMIKELLSQDKKFSEIKLDDIVIEGVDKVKFGAIVGNPPYQEIISESDDNRSLGKQLFPHFIRISIELTDRYSSIISPSKWFTANAQDNSFPKLREYLKTNNHFRTIYNITSGKTLFNGPNLGSVNYFLFDKKYNGNVEFKNDMEKNSVFRPLFEEGVDQIISLNSIVSILNKVRSNDGFITLTSITKGRNAFGLTGKEANSKTVKKKSSGYYEVRCSYERIRYIEKSEISKNKELANQYKIFISKANGAAGILGEKEKVSILGKPYVGLKNSICTDSLIPIGGFDTKEEAINLSKYLKSKFVRFMVGILKSSQNLTQIVYEFVPLQDYTGNSDIEWSKSIEDIDRQLYKKYGLNANDIDFIESNIQTMD